MEVSSNNTNEVNNGVKLEEFVTLKCVKEGSNKLRVKVISVGYSSTANCLFPKNIRVEGREYIIPKADIIMAETKGKFFYRVKKNNIKIVEKDKGDDIKKDSVIVDASFKVYGDEDLKECAICLEDVDSNPEIIFVILVKCGHYALCNNCAYNCKVCPLCRSPIEKIITKDQLQ